MLRSEGEGRPGDAARTHHVARGAPHVRLADDRGRVNAKVLSTYMGHANISITLDCYGHLMPGNEAQAAKLLHAYLDAATV